MDARATPEGVSPLRVATDAHLGRRHEPDRLPGHLLLRDRHRQGGPELGRRAGLHPQARTTGWGSPRRRRSTSPGWAASTTPRSCTTTSGPISRSRASSSWAPTRPWSSTRTSSASTSGRSSRPMTTSSRRSTPRSGAAARFIYVPPGVHVELPLQAYFRINTENMGQFERTLIIADEGSSVHYVEGCTAPSYSTASLHSAVVEIIVKKGARVRYTTIQNWSHNVYNLVTKRAVAHEDAVMEWVDGNLGSHLTMKYPSIYLRRRAGPRRGPEHRLRGRRPAPGCGRQGHPCRAEHDQPDHLQVDQQGNRPHLVPRPDQGLPRLPSTASQRFAATRSSSPTRHARTRTRTWRSTRRT